MSAIQPLSTEREYLTQETLPWGDGDLSAIDWAILQAVAYADVFDYPLTSAEIYYYLVGVLTPREAVDTIGGDSVPPRKVAGGI